MQEEFGPHGRDSIMSHSSGVALCCSVMVLLCGWTVCGGGRPGQAQQLDPLGVLGFILQNAGAGMFHQSNDS
jgi:hypothetical protein